MPAATPDAGQDLRASWPRVAELVRGDIVSGRFPAGTPLPVHKKLADMYDVSDKTLTLALRSLVRRRILSFGRRKYRVPRARPSAPGNRIVLLAMGEGETLHLVTPRTHDHLRILESECAQDGISLDYYAFDMAYERMERPAALFDLLDGSTNTMGFVIWQIGSGGDPRFAAFMETLVRRGKPVAVLLEGEQVHPLPRPTARHPVRYFTLAYSPISGYQTGRYLLELGHRRAAFFTLFLTDDEPGMERFHGFQKAYSEAGFASGALHCQPLVPQLDYRFAAVDMMRSSVEAMVWPRVELVQGPADGSGVPATTGMRLTVSRREPDRELSELMEPVFDHALSHSEVTAWVGYNDAIALEALSFLQRKGVTVPADISVSGFDDGVAACLNKLSSYNFNGNATIRAMVNHIVYHGKWPPLAGEADTPVEIKGFITARKTTRFVLP